VSVNYPSPQVGAQQQRWKLSKPLLAYRRAVDLIVSKHAVRVAYLEQRDWRSLIPLDLDCRLSSTPGTGGQQRCNQQTRQDMGRLHGLMLFCSPVRPFPEDTDRCNRRSVEDEASRFLNVIAENLDDLVM
jgi:hypothetical protein